MDSLTSCLIVVIFLLVSPVVSPCSVSIYAGYICDTAKDGSRLSSRFDAINNIMLHPSDNHSFVLSTPFGLRLLNGSSNMVSTIYPSLPHSITTPIVSFPVDTSPTRSRTHFVIASNVLIEFDDNGTVLSTCGNPSGPTPPSLPPLVLSNDTLTCDMALWYGVSSLLVDPTESFLVLLNESNVLTYTPSTRETRVLYDFDAWKTDTSFVHPTSYCIDPVDPSHSFYVVSDHNLWRLRYDGTNETHLYRDDMHHLQACQVRSVGGGNGTASLYFSYNCNISLLDLTTGIVVNYLGSNHAACWSSVLDDEQLKDILAYAGRLWMVGTTYCTVYSVEDVAVWGQPVALDGSGAEPSGTNSTASGTNATDLQSDRMLLASDSATPSPSTMSDASDYPCLSMSLPLFGIARVCCSTFNETLHIMGSGGAVLLGNLELENTSLMIHDSALTINSLNLSHNHLVLMNSTLNITETLTVNKVTLIYGLSSLDESFPLSFQGESGDGASEGKGGSRGGGYSEGGAESGSFPIVSWRSSLGSFDEIVVMNTTLITPCRQYTLSPKASSSMVLLCFTSTDTCDGDGGHSSLVDDKFLRIVLSCTCCLMVLVFAVVAWVWYHQRRNDLVQQITNIRKKYSLHQQLHSEANGSTVP